MCNSTISCCDVMRHDDKSQKAELSARLIQHKDFFGLDNFAIKLFLPVARGKNSGPKDLCFLLHFKFVVKNGLLLQPRIHSFQFHGNLSRSFS